MRSSFAVVLTEDPLSGLPVGADVPITPVVFGGSDAGRVPDGVKNWNFFEGALLTVVFRNEEGVYPMGTAVLIAPGLAVTATHVFDDHLEAMLRGGTGVICVGPRGSTGDAWRVRSISSAPADDIAFLSVELASAISADWRFTSLPMTTRTPKNGETLHVVGFRFEAVGSGESGLSLGGDLFCAAGPVIAVYPVGRDNLLLPYPPIEVACGSLGAMSGGAVLDGDGCLVGIISRGLATDDGEGPAFAQWIVSALHREVMVAWLPGLYPQPVHLLDLDEGLLRLQGRDAVQLSTDRSFRYRTWFDS